jgi:hypothetical protein
LEIKVRAFDETKFIRGLHKVAHRITAGLLMAALIIGASNLMKMDVSPKLLGYPAIPLLVFLSAATAGIIWLWRAAWADDAEEHH